MALTDTARARIQARRDYLMEHGSRLVIDGDVHPTDADALPPEMAERMARDPDYFHGRALLSERLVPQLDQAGVDMALCWQNPATLPYSGDKADNARRLREANARISALAERHPTRVIPAGWTDPKALGTEAAVALARTCVEEFAMPVVKMNPAQNAYPIDDPMVMEVVDEIVSLGAVPAFHFGADTGFTPTEGLATVAARHPEHPVIGVHMGGGGGHFVESEETYQSARKLGLAQPNVFYVLSAKRDAHMESDLIAYADAGAARLAVASDAPYGGIAWNFGGFRTLFARLSDGAAHGDPRLAARPGLFDEAMIAGFMGGNLAALIAEADARLLG
ncbi:amidohydrolase family protein [Halovulum sp. GXIMD14794]